ncbi:hypothetical protein SYNPS1DRAFT_33212 [Syncephalis pseudoplumigaleata]|uniref:NADH-cytochrome b5 reductase n=1 Tax=Syncephalis pseudoplumigaleata TaxID=1712513 RepID=A0A4P9YWQ6_9FUNG|nr:hypothetical protein SYNPS1DRAFT_33212 [Syncephalis pseudoplumigaleata]|eukprot:RKP24467.1 hypothetical protein SYNPS1DRAFT_33212 [Syncephalis pseudoplumigaleata]
MEELLKAAQNNPWLAVIAALAGVATSSYLMQRLNASSSKRKVLDTQEFRKFPLVEKRVISHNTALYRFALPSSDDVLGLPIGQHISVQATIDGKDVMRSYTPMSSDDDRGHFDLVIKSYPLGRISKMFSELKIGDHIQVRGPKGAFKYEPNLVKHLGMIAGGTGITPMLQVIRAILKNPADTTQISLIFANISEEDILLREDLDALARQHDQFSVYYVLNNEPEGWTGGVGFVTEEMIRTHCPPPSADSKILLCGPPPMVKAMSEHCVNIGFDKPNTISKLADQVFKF